MRGVGRGDDFDGERGRGGQVGEEVFVVGHLRGEGCGD